MHFEITLRNKNNLAQHLSYGLVFIPSPVWIKGDEQLINLNPSSPMYQLGSVKKLLDKENLKFNLEDNNEAVIVVNQVGHGVEEDMDNLNDDLAANGFTVKVYVG